MTSGASTHVEGQPASAELKWRRVVLVCGECEDRKDGPRHLTAKESRRALKQALRPLASDVRVVVGGCLGPCVKRALTVAVAGAEADAPAFAFAVCHHDELDAVARRVAAR